MYSNHGELLVTWVDQMALNITAFLHQELTNDNNELASRNLLTDARTQNTCCFTACNKR